MRMALSKNIEVNLTKYIDIDGDGKRRYCPAVYNVNKAGQPTTIKAHRVYIKGADGKPVETYRPDGKYVMDWTQGGKRERQTLGTDPQDAESQKRNKAIELAYIATGNVVAPRDSKEEASGLTILEAKALYLDEIRKTKTHGTWQHYGLSLRYFVESLTYVPEAGLPRSRKVYLSDITRQDALEFNVYLRDELDLLPNTRWSKFNALMIWLRWNELFALRNTIKAKDWPKRTFNPVEIYDPEDGEIPALMRSADEFDAMWIEFLTETGVRRAELAYMTIGDFKRNLNPPEIAVVDKEWAGGDWIPKGAKGRRIPIDPAFATKLAAFIDRRGLGNRSRAFMFGKDDGMPHCYSYYYSTLKRIARDAGLNCLECDGCKARGECEKYYLHKFRQTYGVMTNEGGATLPSVKELLGHTPNSTATSRYTRGSSGKTLLPVLRNRFNLTYGRPTINRLIRNDDEEVSQTA